MSQNKSIFSNLLGDLSVISIGDQAWFLADEVYAALGLFLRNDPQTLVLQQSEWSVMSSQSGVTNAQTPVVISEAGVYKLAFLSEEPEVREFQDWAMNTLLPTIIHDGFYMMGEEEMFSTPECDVTQTLIQSASLKASREADLELLCSVILPELRVDGAFFRDLPSYVEQPVENRELRVRQAVSLKQKRRLP